MSNASTIPTETKKLLYVLIPFALTLGMALDLYLPSIPRISNSLNTSIEMVQWTMSGFFLCFGVGQLFIGPISDHIGRKKTIFFSLILYISGSIIAAISPNIETLIASRAIQAFGSCGTQISAFSIVKDTIKDQKLSERIFTYLKGSMGFAPMAAPIIGSFIDYHFSWRVSFYVLSFFGIALMTLDYIWLKESLAHKDRVKISPKILESYFIMIKDKHFVGLALCVVASQAVLFTFFSLSPHIIISKFGYSSKFFGYCFALNALTYTFASWICGKAIYKIGTYGCIKIGGTMMLAGSTFLMAFIFSGSLGIESLIIAGLLSSSGSSFILGPATSAAIDRYRTTTGAATALVGSIEAISAAFIGNMAIKYAHFDGLTFAVIVLISGTVALLASSVRNFNTGSESN